MRPPAYSLDVIWEGGCVLTHLPEGVLPHLRWKILHSLKCVVFQSESLHAARQSIKLVHECALPMRTMQIICLDREGGTMNQACDIRVSCSKCVLFMTLI